MRLDGKQVVVTAAAQGIGRATAEAFAREGARVWATDINLAKLAELSSISGITTHQLDVRDTAAVQAIRRRNGADRRAVQLRRIRPQRYGAGLHRRAVGFRVRPEREVDVPHHPAFLPGMLAKGEGCIINMSSVASSIKGVPSRFAYTTTKAAVIGLTKSVAADYVGKGIRCNAICPGTVQSPSLEDRLRALGDYEKAREAFIARQPIGRIGTPEEIADLAVYLATATYTTGQCHIIDGGWAV